MATRLQGFRLRDLLRPGRGRLLLRGGPAHRRRIGKMELTRELRPGADPTKRNFSSFTDI
jgi:hypothetical protein